MGESIREIRQFRSGGGYLVFPKTNRAKAELLKSLPDVKIREPKSGNNEHQLIIMGVNRSIDEKAVEYELNWKNVPFSKVIWITSSYKPGNSFDESLH